MSGDPRRKAALHLAAMHPAGLLSREGRIDGFWYVDGHLGNVADPMAEVVLAMRDGAGVATGRTRLPLADDDFAGSVGEAWTAGMASTSRTPPPRIGHGKSRAPNFGEAVSFIRPSLADPRTGTASHVSILEGTVQRRYPVLPRSVVNGIASERLLAIGKAVAPFIDALDATALAMVEANGLHSRIGDRWGSIDATMGGSPTLRDAIAERPDLMAILMGRHADAPDKVDWLITCGGPEAVVGEWLRTSFAMAPRLASCFDPATRAIAGIDDRHSLWHVRTPITGKVPKAVDALWLARALPANWLPDDDWAGLVDALPVVHAALRLSGPGSLAAFLGAGRDWPAWLAKLGKAGGGPHPLNAVTDLDDAAIALAAQVVRPALALAGLDDGDVPLHRKVAWAALYRGRGLRRCLEVSARWHVARTAIEARLCALPRAGEPPPRTGGRARALGDWPAGLPDARVGDLDVKVLVTGAALTDEGRPGPGLDGVEGLSHCVGGFAGECLDGTSRIVSIRRRGGNGSYTRLSTADLRLGDGFVRIVQHRGRGNANPPGEAVRALDLYVSGPGAEPDLAAWTPVPGRSRSVSSLYDPAVGDNMALAEEAWADFLPGQLVGIGFAGWAELAIEATSWPANPAWRPEQVQVPVSAMTHGPRDDAEGTAHPSP